MMDMLRDSEGNNHNNSLFGRLVTVRSGALEIFPDLPKHLTAFLDYLPLIGLVALLLQPTFVSLFPQNSKIYAGAVLLLMLPCLRRILIVPFIAIVGLHFFLIVIYGSMEKISLAIATYALFVLLNYRTKAFFAVFFSMICVAGFVAALQFVIPSQLLNFHATASSVNNFQDQYRPTSIFPAQVYFSQLLLLTLPILFIARESRGWVMLAFGSFAAITGATAGVACALLALGLDKKQRCYLVPVGFLAVFVAMSIYNPSAASYNYAPSEIKTSVLLRTGSDAKTTADAGESAQTTDTSPNLQVIIKSIAMAGIVLAAMLALQANMSLGRLVPLAAVSIAFLVAQILHETLGSLFSTLSCAILVTLCWQLNPADRHLRL